MFKDVKNKKWRVVVIVCMLLAVVASLSIPVKKIDAATYSMYVVNFKEMVTLWIASWIEQWKEQMNFWVKQQTNEFAFWSDQLSKPPTFLFNNKDINKSLSLMYFNEYKRIRESIDSGILGSKKNWYSIMKSQEYRTPSTLWALNSSNYNTFDNLITKYAQYICLEQGFMEDITKSDNFRRLSRPNQDYFLRQIKNIDNAKQAITNDVVSASATLKTVSSFKEELNSKINLANLNNATQTQVLKDIAQLMYINNMLLIELIKVHAEERINRSSIDVLAIDKDVREINEAYRASIK